MDGDDGVAFIVGAGEEGLDFDIIEFVDHVLGRGSDFFQELCGIGFVRFGDEVCEGKHVFASFIEMDDAGDG